MINLFQLPGGHVLADLPGYGYAAVPKKEKKLWGVKITQFLHEPKIAGAVLVTDCRRGLGVQDIALINIIPQKNILVLMNKADKLGRQQLKKQLSQAQNIINDIAPHAQILPFSASKKTGLKDVRAAAADILSNDSHDS